MSRWNLRVDAPTTVLSTCTLAAMGMAGSALAQAPDDGIEDIVVTAQFREQNLQQTPLAISAFSGALLEARGASDTNDIDMFVPNAVIQPLGAGWGSYQYREESEFSEADENVTVRKSGALAVGGIEYRAHRWVGVSADVQYTTIKGVLGKGGLSQELKEDDLGGISARFRIIIGR